LSVPFRSPKRLDWGKVADGNAIIVIIWDENFWRLMGIRECKCDNDNDDDDDDVDDVSKG
jgi:hypothetical protein